MTSQVCFEDMEVVSTDKVVGFYGLRDRFTFKLGDKEWTSVLEDYEWTLTRQTKGLELNKHSSILSDDFLKELFDNAYREYKSLSEAHMNNETDLVLQNLIPEKDSNQSKIDTRMDLLPPQALLEIAKVMAEAAAKYGEWNHVTISVPSHINHAMTHICNYQLTGDTEELSHATTRVLLALDNHLRNKKTSEAIANYNL